MTTAALCVVLVTFAYAQFLGSPRKVDGIVKSQMAKMPKDLHLSAAQRRSLEKLYRDAASKEQDILKLTQNRFAQRQQIREVSSDLDGQIKKLLSVHQYQILYRSLHQSKVR